MNTVIKFLYEDALGGWSLDDIHHELACPGLKRTSDGESYKQFLEKYLVCSDESKIKVPIPIHS